MGFDVHGIKPKTEEGNYFRNNCWWWRPLWELICDNCSDILTEDQMQKGCYNDGAKITSKQAKKIYIRLMEDIGEDQLKKYQMEHESERLQAEKDNGDKKCSDDTFQWKANYPFDADNVIEFANFCKESGGFEIY